MQISALRDNFDDNSQASAWSNAYAVGSATKAETGGQAAITLPSSTAGSHEAAYVSAATYDLTGDVASINVPTMVSTSVAAYAFFRLQIDASNALQIIQQSGTMKFQKIVAGVTTDLASVSYSSSTHRWWRIRESGGTIFFDTSTNASGGASWTNRASTANPFALTALSIVFGAGCGNVASPGSAKFDDFNQINGLATTWHWTKQQRPLIDRYKILTAGATGGQFYIGVSTDDSSYTWYAGPLAADGRTLTAQASEAAAQAMAVNFSAGQRFELPAMIEARFVKIGHRSISGSSYRIDELYARRYLETDDFAAESVKAITIASGVIDVNHLVAVLTITGKTIRTAASGQRVELTSAGLATYDSSGNVQVTADTTSDGAISAGGGHVVLNKNGLYLETLVGGSHVTTYANWSYAGAVKLVAGLVIASGVLSKALLSAATTLQIETTLTNTGIILTTGGGSDYIQLASSAVNIPSGGLNLGSKAGAGAGEIRAALVTSDLLAGLIDDAATNTAPMALVLRHRSSGTPAAGLGTKLVFQANETTTADVDQADIVALWANAAHGSQKGRMLLRAVDATTAREFLRGESNGSAPMIGFLGANAVVQQASGADLTNNVTSGGTTDTITNWTNLSTYSTDAAAIRNAVYQLARKLKQVNDALRLYGLLS